MCRLTSTASTLPAVAGRFYSAPAAKGVMCQMSFAMLSEGAIEVRESKAEGLGLFAAKDISKGVAIRRVSIVREISDSDPIDSERGELPEHCSCHDGKIVLIGYPDRHMNHSCEPNTFYDYSDDLPLTRAIRNIYAGEELTVDYLINNPGGDTWVCRCGSSRCRGQTGVSFFTLPRSFQQEYLPFLAPWFRARYADRLEKIERGT